MTQYYTKNVTNKTAAQYGMLPIKFKFKHEYATIQSIVKIMYSVKISAIKCTKNKNLSSNSNT